MFDQAVNGGHGFGDVMFLGPGLTEILGLELPIKIKCLQETFKNSRVAFVSCKSEEKNGLTLTTSCTDWSKTSLRVSIVLILTCCCSSPETHAASEKE